jgi:hypothetical protein
VGRATEEGRPITGIEKNLMMKELGPFQEGNGGVVGPLYLSVLVPFPLVEDLITA